MDMNAIVSTFLHIPICLLFSICLTILHVASAAAVGWQIVHPQTSVAEGTGTQPSIRYGHTCNAYKGDLLVTHGYYYDRPRAAPTWLSDTWAMAAADGTFRWECWSGNLPQAVAYNSYSTGRKPRAPCGRFGHVSAIIGDALFLYGGNDGGYSRTNRDDYKPGHDFDELWRLDLTNLSWSLVRPTGAGPGKRHMAGGTAVQGSFIVYGGIGPDRGDAWSYSPTENRWELLVGMVRTEQGGPGERCGHGMVPWTTPLAAGFVMYGGQSRLPSGSYVVRSDAWFFDLAMRSWRQLQPVGGLAEPVHSAGGGGSDGDAALTPPGHFYQAVMAADLTLPPAAVRAAARAAACRANAGVAACSPATTATEANDAVAAVQIRVGVVAGGSTTTPGLTCSSQVWAFTLDCTATRIIWARLAALPSALYDTRGAAVGAAAYVFGGHLCSQDRSPGPPDPVSYVNEALRLDLDVGLDDPDLDVGLVGADGVAALLRGGVGGDTGSAACVTAWAEAGASAAAAGWVALVGDDEL
jgi:hypothetical protein